MGLFTFFQSPKISGWFMPKIAKGCLNPSKLRPKYCRSLFYSDTVYICLLSFPRCTYNDYLSFLPFYAPQCRLKPSQWPESWYKKRSVSRLPDGGNRMILVLLVLRQSACDRRTDTPQIAKGGKNQSRFAKVVNRSSLPRFYGPWTVYIHKWCTLLQWHRNFRATIFFGVNNRQTAWCLTLTSYSAKATIVLHPIIRSWYTGRWWVCCHIWYSEEGPGRNIQWHEASRGLCDSWASYFISLIRSDSSVVFRHPYCVMSANETRALNIFRRSFFIFYHVCIMKCAGARISFA